MFLNVLSICKAPLNILYELLRYINLYNNNNNICTVWFMIYTNILLIIRIVFFKILIQMLNFSTANNSTHENCNILLCMLYFNNLL